MKYSKFWLSCLTIVGFTVASASNLCTLNSLCYFQGEVAGQERGAEGNGTLVYFQFPIDDVGNYICALSAGDETYSKAVSAGTKIAAEVYAGQGAKFSPQTIQIGTPIALNVEAMRHTSDTTAQIKFRLLGDRVYPRNTVGVQCASAPASSSES